MGASKLSLAFISCGVMGPPLLWGLISSTSGLAPASPFISGRVGGPLLFERGHLHQLRGLAARKHSICDYPFTRRMTKLHVCVKQCRCERSANDRTRLLCLVCWFPPPESARGPRHLVTRPGSLPATAAQGALRSPEYII